MNVGTHFSAAVVAAALLVPPVSSQDSLLTLDGRTVSGPSMTSGPDVVTIHLASGDVTIPRSMVKHVAASKVADGVAETPEAIKNKEKGLVEFEGKWVSPSARDAQLARRRVANEKRISDLIAHSKWGSHYKMKSKYFLFEYNIEPEVAKEWADLMDAYYDSFVKFWDIKPAEGYKKLLAGGGSPGLQVNLYNNQPYFQQVTGMPQGVGGFFRFVPPIQLHFYVNRAERDLTMHVMFHECSHYLQWLINIKYDPPGWLAEGLAEYYGASEWDPKTKKLSVGGILEFRIAQIQQSVAGGKWVSLDELLKAPDPFDGGYYPWAWSFVHFLMKTDYEKRFRTFVQSIFNDKVLKRQQRDYGEGYSLAYHEPDQIVIGLKRDLKIADMKALETQWHDYIKQMKPSSAKGYFSAAENFLSAGMPIKAKRMIEIAFEKGYASADAFALYARILQGVPTSSSDDRERNLVEARKQFEKALEADPIDPLLRAEYAELLNDSARFYRKADPEVEKQIKLARELSSAVEFGLFDFQVFLNTSFTVYTGEGN